MPVKLDATDRRIVAALQADGRITNVGLADQVGISPPPCLRRVRTLEEAGVIRGYHAEVDAASLGYSVSAYAMVGLHSQSEAGINAFIAKIETWPLVREATMLSGEVDFLLRCVAPDLETFQSFVMHDLTAAPNVESVRTSLVLGRPKFAPGVPLG